VKTLRELALRYPEAEEGIACAGTAIEKRTIKVRSKAFLFLGTADAMLKLGDSLAEAAKLAAKEPELYKTGAKGWVTVKIDADASPPFDVLARWIDESYRLLAPEQLVSLLPERGLPSKNSTKTAKRNASKKKPSRKSGP
jgi:hypothetical protein